MCNVYLSIHLHLDPSPSEGFLIFVSFCLTEASCLNQCSKDPYYGAVVFVTAKKVRLTFSYNAIDYVLTNLLPSFFLQQY